MDKIYSENKELSDVKVLTLNTFGIPFFGTNLVHRYHKIGQIIEAEKFDIINFQEVVTYFHLRHLKKNLQSYPYACFVPSMIGPLGGLATFSRLPLSVVKLHRFSVSHSPDSKGLPPFTLLKSRFKGILISHSPKLALSVLNTHPIANTDGDWSEENRFYQLQKSQLAQISKLVQKIKIEKKEHHIILTGDFNIAKDSVLYKDFIKELPLKDVHATSSNPTFHADFLSENAKPQCIDFIFFSSQLDFRDTRLLFADKILLGNGCKEYISDHLGIAATATLAS